MSTDRELLKLAAKAAGIDLIDRALGAAGYVIDGGKYWNPLTDDGDALRLAVKLRMSVTVFEDKVGIGIRDWGYCEYDVEGGDYCAATRRAIARAAAAIAKEKQP